MAVIQVKQGDTLAGLAEGLSSTVDVLLALNPSITDPNLITIGQELVVPESIEEAVIQETAPVPTGTERTIISSETGARVAETDLQGLQDTITNIEAQALQIQERALVETKTREEEEARRVAALRVVEGEEVEKVEPTQEEKDLESLLLQYDAQQRFFEGELTKLRARMDETDQGIIDGLRLVFIERRKQQEDINKRSLASMQKFGFKLGLAEFSPLLQNQLLISEESAGLNRLRKIDAEEQIALANARRARDENQFDVLHEQMNQLRDKRNEKRDELVSLREKMDKKNEELNERIRNFEKTFSIIESISSGISDPMELLREMQTKNLDVTISDIKEAYDFVFRQEDEASGLGAFNLFQKLKDEGQIDEGMSFIEFSTMYSAAKRKPEKVIRTRTDLTPFELLQARALSRVIFGVRAGRDPVNIELIEGLVAGGMSIDQIGDELRYGRQSPEMTGIIRDAVESVAAALKSDADREFFIDSVDRSLENGDMPRVKELLVDNAIRTFGATEGQLIRGEKRAVELFDEIRDDLKRLQNIEGIDTNIFTGTQEQVLKKIGLVKSVSQREIANKIQIAIQRYRRSISGAAFTESEAVEYRSIFPSISNTAKLNLALVDSAREVMNGNVEFALRERIGSNAFSALFDPEPEPKEETTEEVTEETIVEPSNLQVGSAEYDYLFELGLIK